jgi:K+/H+ antiporter YhaU regulatory subunit KhtT
MAATKGASMRKVKVRHHRLPGIGDRFDLDTTSGSTVTVIGHRSGRRDLAISAPGAEAPEASTGLTRSEAAAIALLLTGAHVELTTIED